MYQMEEERDVSSYELSEEKYDPLEEIHRVIQSVVQFDEYRRTQRKESHNLVRRFKFMLLLWEELHDLLQPFLEIGVTWLTKVKDVLLFTKDLLKLCSQGSKIHLALETEVVMITFQKVYDKLSQAFGDVPCDEIGILDEVKEQDTELAMDMMVVFSDNDDRNADSAIIERLAKKLELYSVESTQKIIYLFNKFKRIASMEETGILDDLVMPKMLERCTSLVIPHEFLYPITLEIMTDLVIITSGQTEKKEIPALVESLSSIHLEEQRQAVEKICMLSKENPENRVLVAEHGGMPSLVKLLSYLYSKIQEHVVKTLLNLSIDEGNKCLISTEGVIPAIIEVLENGSCVVKENSAVALFSLLMLDEIKEIVGQSNGFPPLVDMLRNGTIRGKKDVVTTLFNLSINHANKSRAIRAGIVNPLLQLLKDTNLGMIDEAFFVLLLLVSNSEA
ncbi:U-box domain-containing protein 15 [Glycine soja]